jgi:hypothetical protein
VHDATGSPVSGFFHRSHSPAKLSTPPSAAIINDAAHARETIASIRDRERAVAAREDAVKEREDAAALRAAIYRT